MTLEKLLSEIKMSETYAPKILAAYTKWSETDECTLERAGELLSDNETFKDPEK